MLLLAAIGGTGDGGRCPGRRKGAVGGPRAGAGRCPRRPPRTCALRLPKRTLVLAVIPTLNLTLPVSLKLRLILTATLTATPSLILAPMLDVTCHLLQIFRALHLTPAFLQGPSWLRVCTDL